ncbi:MAG: hypothetical protein ACRD6X_07385 [Pyrinomonadaceae bacterium]
MKPARILLFFLIFSNLVLSQSKAKAEAWETSKMLGVNVKDFPNPQGVGNFDDLPETSPEFKFRVVKRPSTGQAPRPSYEVRSIVKAKASDGTIYEAFCGRFDAKKLWPGFGEASTNANPRQQYESLYGYGFNPADIFIGKREGGRIKTSLFFRDVGSHETAPHYISIDNSGRLHLIVSDVNISDNNELNVYAVIGDPKAGKWQEACLLDRRGFTSWSHPWNGSWQDKTHYLWDWGDANYDTENPNMGLFHVEHGANGLGRKVRVISGIVESFGAAIDPRTGRLVVVAAREDGVFISSRDGVGKWTRPVRLDATLNKRYDVSITQVGLDFVIRTAPGSDREWVVRPQ